jgi:hypothetical protein
MVFVLRVGAQETAAALRVLVGDRQPDDTRVEIPHLHEIIANNSYMSQTHHHSPAPLLDVTVLAIPQAAAVAPPKR